jgi:uncharacterized protein YciI
MAKETTYIYVLKLVGAESPSEISPQQEAIVDEHFEYLKKAFAQGKLCLAGRCLNGEFGIVILQAESEKQAKDFMKSDPAVMKGLMAAELHPFRIAIM